MILVMKKAQNEVIKRKNARKKNGNNNNNDNVEALASSD